jgi:hypothetical protein
VNLYIGKDEGPEIGGVKFLRDFNVYLNFWWRSGTPYTYHAPGDMSTEPNNMRWFDYYQFDLNISKAFDLFGTQLELSVDIKNLLDQKFLRLLYDDDLARYLENPNLPDSERLPKTYDFTEPNIWEWYSYEVPPRRFYFQVAIKF